MRRLCALLLILLSSTAHSTLIRWDVLDPYGSYSVEGGPMQTIEGSISVVWDTANQTTPEFTFQSDLFTGHIQNEGGYGVGHGNFIKTHVSSSMQWWVYSVDDPDTPISAEAVLYLEYGIDSDQPLFSKKFDSDPFFYVHFLIEGKEHALFWDMYPSNIAVVSEPESLALLGIGLIAIGLRRRST